MSAGNWIKIESTNRNSSQLRQTIDQYIRANALLEEVVEKMSQMSSGGTDYAGLEAEYGLQPGEGATVESLLASSQTELEASPFYQQMVTRLG